MRVLVLAKRTSYRALVEQEHDPLVTALLEKGDPSVRRMRQSHQDHMETVEEVQSALRELGANHEIYEGACSPLESQFDLVITVGGDGTLLSASHELGPEIPLLGINSAPGHSVGFFCASKKGAVRKTLFFALEGRLRRTSLARMRVSLNGKVLHRRVLNDTLFCHSSPAATSRYILETEDEGGHDHEEHRSSGIWIGPAAGSTAAQRSAGGKILPLTSRKLQYVVREPYTPIGAPLRLVTGCVDENGRILLRNKMRDSKIFLDGPHIVFNVMLGDVLELQRSDEPVTVLGLTRNGKPQLK